MSHLTVIDFEASSLVDGFPVSVGIARSDGRMFYALVKPHPEWDMGYRWDPNSEAIHGLTREHLTRHGREVSVVVSDIKSMFGVDVAYMSDAPGHDKQWLDELISVSSIDYKPRMFRSTPSMWLTTLYDEHRIELEAILKINELRKSMHTHNALSDAASWVAADEAARAWVQYNDLRKCEAVFETYKHRVREAVAALEKSGVS
ncbi:MAG: hypothetical protein ACK5XB_10450 [Rhodospirillales bacterium]